MSPGGQELFLLILQGRKSRRDQRTWKHHTAENKSLIFECSQPVPRAHASLLPGASLYTGQHLQASSPGYCCAEGKCPSPAQHQLSSVPCFIALCSSPQLPNCRNFMDHHIALIPLLICVFIIHQLYQDRIYKHVIHSFKMYNSAAFASSQSCTTITTISSRTFPVIPVPCSLASCCLTSTHIFSVSGFFYHQHFT